MSFTKTEIYNLALSALMLNANVIDVATDESNNVTNLNRFYNVALQSTLQDLDLDAVSQPITLELIETLTEGNWLYVYKYPSNCSFLRRLKSAAEVDDRTTHLPKRIALHNGVKAIFTNEVGAVGECIAKDTPLEALSPMAAMAVAYKLAYLSAPLIVGKGAKKLRETIQTDYVLSKAEAQEYDSLENFNYEADYQRSDFVRERLS